MSVRHDSGSRLLLHEQPLQVLPSLARLLGINAAIAIQQIHWVICIKEENEDNRTLFDGYLWCKYTIAKWQNKLCWLTPDGIYKILRKLESDGLVVCCKPDSHNRDQTKWYRIDYENLAKLSDSVQTPISDSVQTPISDSVQTPISDSVQNDLYQKDLKDLKKKDADDFFVIAPSSQIKENSFSAQAKNPNIQDPQTPKPLSPVSPENLPKRVYADPMGDRFANKGPSRKAITEPLTKDEDFLRYLFTRLKTKPYYKDLTDRDDLEPIRVFIRKSWFLGAEGDARFAEMENYIKDYEKYKKTISVQQRSQPQQTEAEKPFVPISSERSKQLVAQFRASRQQKQAEQLGIAS